MANLKTLRIAGFSRDVQHLTAGEGITIENDVISAIATDLSNYYNKSEVDSMISAIDEFNVEVVAELPSTGEEKTIYLVPKSSSQADNVRDEYMWINNAWELIGDTAVDLSGYYTTAQTDALLNNKVDKVAGKGLSTNDYTTAEKSKLAGIEANAEVNVQSDWNVTDSSSDAFIKNKPTIPDMSNYYNKTQVDAALANKQNKLTAGSNVQISGNTISATDTKYTAGTGLQLSGTQFSAKLGYTTSGNNRKVQADANGNLYVIQKDNNTTYTAGTGLVLSGTTINHSNSVTALTTAGLRKIAYDGQGHITSSSAVSKTDILNILGYKETTISMTSIDGTVTTETILVKQ